MRFFISIVLLVGSIVALVVGIAQQTWLKPAATVTEQLALTGEAPAVIVKGDLLNAHAEPVTVTVHSSGPLSAGVAIDSDVTAWLGDGKADVFSVDGTNSIQARQQVGTATDIPSAGGSDLWLQEFAGEDTLAFSLSVPSSESVIITGNAPSSLSLTWAQDTSTPLAVPLVVIGGVALIGGSIMLALALRHERRVVSPRRSSRRGVDPGRSKAAGRKRKGRRAASMVALGASALALSTALTGCVSGAASSASASGSDAAANTVVSEQSPHLTTDQVTRIIAEISDVAARADEKRDPTLLATRFAGAALQIREKNYEIRGKDSKIASLASIPAVTPTVFVPQLDPAWPRQAFVVVDDPSNSNPPLALTLVQDSARSNYLVRSVVELFSDITFPALPTAEDGGVSLAPDTTLLSIAPSSVGNAYSDLIASGESSSYAGLFSATTDAFITATKVHEQSVAKDLGTQGSVTFSRSQDAGTPALSISTADSGALVAVFVLDTETSKPKSGYELTISGDAKALLGKSSTKKGLKTTYGDMLLFSVPAAGSTEAKAQLLGFSSGLVNVEELS